MLKKILPLYLLFLFNLAFSQQALLKNFSTKNGLPGNETYFLHHDKKGYIWICSDAGIIKYNGNYFKNFNVTNGLPDNTIFEVKEDKHGRIWFRSFSGKIGYIFNDSVHVIKANSKIEEFVRYGIVSSFAIDDNDILYLGRRNDDNISFLKIHPPYSANNVSEIWKKDMSNLQTDIVLVGADDFVFSDARKLGKGTFFKINVYDPLHELILTDSLELNDQALFSRVYRDKNHIYVLAYNLLLTIDLVKITTKRKLFKNNLITAMTIQPNTMVVSEVRKGLISFSDNLKSPFPDRLLNGQTVTYIVPDYQGGYWFSTLESGIYYMPPSPVHSTRLSPDPARGSSRMFSLNDSTLLVGSQNGDITKVNIARDNKISIKDIYIDHQNRLGQVSDFLKINDNDIIISGHTGRIVYNHSSQKFRHAFANKSTTRQYTLYKDSILGIHIRNIIISPKNNPWEYQREILTRERLSSIHYDSVADRIYIGGLKGLYKFYFQNELRDSDKILNTRVEDISSESGKLFVATNAEGIIIIGGKKNDTINERSGLISNICKSITVKNKIIWVSTNKGISLINYSGTGNYSIQNYPLNYFVDAASVSRISLMSDKAFFHSGNDLYWFNTNGFTSKSNFYISQVFVNNEPAAIKARHELKHSESNISISYEALFYDCSEEITYRYKIDKATPDWNYTKETSLYFPNLAPGQYEFIIEALNNNGAWVRANKQLIFIIDKPLWLKTWFLITVLFVLLILMSIILRARYTRLLKNEAAKNELKISMYELETKAVKAQMNPHFIFNSLNSIQQFILAGDTDNAFKYLSKFSKLVRKLLESNTTESISLEDEIDLLNRYVEIEMLRFEDAFTCEMHVDEKLKVRLIRIPHMLIQPFVENAIWHGLLHKKDNKKLAVSFSYLDEKTLNCRVEDNGVGRYFKPQGNTPGKTSLALNLIQQRLELLSKTKGINCGYTVTDKANACGTIINITIPVLNKI